VTPPPSESVFDVRATELALFVGGALATLLTLVVAAWLFVRASREERERQASGDGREGAAGDGERRP
jgi:flagellar biogenesis protein FliO